MVTAYYPRKVLPRTDHLVAYRLGMVQEVSIPYHTGYHTVPRVMPSPTGLLVYRCEAYQRDPLRCLCTYIYRDVKK